MADTFAAVVGGTVDGCGAVVVPTSGVEGA